MDRAYGDFVDAIALDGDEGIGFGDGWKWMASIDVAAQREYALRPAAVAQPTACIEFVGRESEEVVDRPLHAEGSGERCGDARIRGRRYVCDAVFDYEHGVWQKIRCVDAKAKVAVTFISTSTHRTLSAGVPTDLIRGDLFQWGSIAAAVLIPSIPLALLYNLLPEPLHRRIHGRCIR